MGVRHPSMVCMFHQHNHIYLHIVLYAIKKNAVGVKEQTLPRRLGHTFLVDAGCISI